MTQPSTTISALIVRYVNDEATPEEKRQVEEWASLSAENRTWLQQLSNEEWLQEQVAIFKKIDLDERCNTFWSMVAAQETQQAAQEQRVQPTPTTPQIQPIQQSDKPVTRKVLPMVKSLATVAAVCIIAFTAWFYFILPRIKTNATAGFSSPMPPGIMSIRQPNVFRISTDNSLPTVDTLYTVDRFVPTGQTVDSFARTGLYKQVLNDSEGYEAVNEPLYHKVPIPAAGYREIKLPDSSRVWLSSMTTFTYPAAFSGDKRIVEITGEAYFEVDSNAATPFEAIVNGVHIETKGGWFNIKAHALEAFKKVTVLHGSVRVAEGPYDVLVKENQSALVEQKKRIAITIKEDTAKVMAWKDKRFLFKKDSLAIVIREMARRYNLKLAGNINSDALISYAGSRLEEPEVVLKKMQQLNRNFLYTYDIANRKLTIE